VTITTDALPNMVKAYTRMSLRWSIREPGETTYRVLQNTSQFVYVTLAPPTGTVPDYQPTKTRLNFACYAAAQENTALGVTDKIHDGLDADPPCDGRSLDLNADAPACRGTGGTIVSNWSLMAGKPYVGECDQQAHFMNLAIPMLGVAPGAEYKTYASRDTQVTSIERTTAQALGVTQDLDGDGQIGDETLELIFDFDPPPNPEPAGWEHDWNLFEGSISAGGRYYAVWPSFEADSEFELFCEVVQGIEQRWVYRVVGPGGTWSVAYAHPGTVAPPACPP